MKLFSPDKANALIPRIAPLVEELWRKRRDLAIRLLENDPVLRGAEQTPRSRMAAPRSPFVPGRFSEQKAEIVRIINRIEAHGCLVKDVDLGLVDFPTSIDGEPAYLCWKAGESQVAYWHPIDEGFASRRPI